MSTTVKIVAPAAEEIVKNHNLEDGGSVQQYWTSIVNRRMTNYMPFRSGALATKLKFQANASEIVVAAPYARYQYEGKVMVNAATGKGAAYIPGVGFRYPRGAILKQTNRPLNYDTTKHPLAGDKWDVRLVENEQDDMIAELKNFVKKLEEST